MAAGTTVPYGPRCKLWRVTLPDSETLLVTPPSGDSLTRQSMFPDKITPELWSPTSPVTPSTCRPSIKVSRNGWRETFSITLLLCGMPSGHMTQLIPRATGATSSQWGPQRAIFMHFGVPAWQLLEVQFRSSACPVLLPEL